MDATLDQRDLLLAAWKTNNRVTVFLVEHLPQGLWAATIPGAPRRTVRMIAGHIHNARCTWIKTLGKEHGIAVPHAVNRHKVERKELISALGQSSRGIANLLTLGFDKGGTIPVSSSYTWRNLPLDVGHVLTYLVAHEGHHRGQIVMLARQLGYRLPIEITGGLALVEARQGVSKLDFVDTEHPLKCTPLKFNGVCAPLKASGTEGLYRKLSWIYACSGYPT
ncbi:MAG: DinB family protein [Pyrinomonadaceae bacterium]